MVGGVRLLNLATNKTILLLIFILCEGHQEKKCHWKNISRQVKWAPTQPYRNFRIRWALSLVGRFPLHESYWLIPLLVVLKLANCVKIDHEIWTTLQSLLRYVSNLQRVKSIFGKARVVPLVMLYLSCRLFDDFSTPSFQSGTSSKHYICQISNQVTMNTLLNSQTTTDISNWSSFQKHEVLSLLHKHLSLSHFILPYFLRTELPSCV